QVSSMAVHDLREARCPEKRIDLPRLAFHRCGDRSIVQHHDSLCRTQLGKRSLELQRLLDAGMNKRLDLWLAESCEDSTSEPADESFCPCETHAVALISTPIKHLDALLREHSHKVAFVAALVIVIAEHNDCRKPQSHQHVQ